MAYTQFVNPREPVFYTRTGGVVRPPNMVEVPQDLVLSHSSFKSSRLSVSMASELDFSFGSSYTEANSTFFLLQFAFYDPNLYIGEYAGEQVGQMFGSALRIGILTVDAKASASLSLPMIAASATVKGMTTKMHVDTIGMDHELSTAITTLISSTSFDATAMTEIGAAIGKFQEMVKANPSLLEPDLIESGDLVSGVNADYMQAVSAAYGLHSITKDRTLSKALDRLSSKVESHDDDYYYPLVNPTLTQAIYYQASNGDPWGPLSSLTKSTAKAIYGNTKAD